MTIHEIAQDLYSSLSPAGRRYISRLSEKDLPKLHLGLGMPIRNRYLLNQPKPQDAVSHNPEYNVIQIIRTMWEIARLESEQPDNLDILDIAS